MLVVLYFVFDVSLLMLMPKYNTVRFVKIPKIKYVTTVNSVLYYLQLALLIFLPLKIESEFFYFGIGFFILGILMFSTAMFFFSISEVQYRVTKGIYAVIKHPVYVSFFILMIGASLSTGSIALMLIVFLHFANATILMKEENKMCNELYN